MVKIFRGLGVAIAAYTIISMAVVLGVSTAQTRPVEDALRSIERAVDVHIAGPGHETTSARLDKIEAELAANTDTLAKMIGGGMAISGVVVFLQLATMFGIKPTFGNNGAPKGE